MKNPWTRKINRQKRRPLQKKIEYSSWIILGGLLLLSLAFGSARFTVGMLAGGLISILNFYGLSRGLKTAFGQMANGGTGKASLIFKYLLRLAVTGLTLYLVLVKVRADIFGLLIGLSTVVIGILISTVLTVIDKSYLEEV